MRIGIDVGPMIRPRTGVGNFCCALLNHMLALGGDFEFRGLSSGLGRVERGLLSGLALHRHIPVPTRALYAVWNAIRAPKADRVLGGVDVFHATNYFLPPVDAARRVLTIYDLAFLVNPAWCSPKVVGPFGENIRRFAREADAVLACSEATKRDIVRLLSVAPDKVTVTPGAVDDGFAPLPRDQAAAHLARRYGIQGPFLLFVSTLEPRKNAPTLVRAFARLADAIPHQLALVGAEGWGAEAIVRAIQESGVSGRVVRPGYVPRGDLPAFYSAADAFVFPSRYEGFGLPVLEAMACGCPVVTSNTSSLPEVGGDAAIQVDPDDVDGLASGIRAVLEDHGLRERLVSRGYEQARRFSWDRCAELTLGVYRGLAR